MTEQEFYNRLGFDDNPFQFTNADEENRLAEYFVPPPYFASVIGNPQKPNSSVIFAPRGGGKSAQRRMIEIEADEVKILAITYDRFEFCKGATIDNISLEYHLHNIVRSVLIGFLYKINLLGLTDMNFYPAEKDFIHKLCDSYLGHLSQAELVNAIKSLRSMMDSIEKYVQKYTTPISLILNAILKSQGIPTLEFKENKEIIIPLDKSPKYNLMSLGELVKKIGFNSIYVLIDKVDETEFTGNDSSASYKLVEPLLKDLELLSLGNYGFKFFLWDELRPYQQKNARPDRVPQFDLKWDRNKVKEALHKRLEAFSGGKVKSLSEITIKEFADSIDDVVLFFANNSPRDIIRLCQEICTQQLEINPNALKISGQALFRGIDLYSRRRVAELIDNDNLRDLRTLRKIDFAINDVAEALAISPQYANTKIEDWEKTGMVKKIGEEKKEPTKRKIYHYAVVDTRLARVIFDELTLAQFTRLKLLWCDRCNCIVLRDWDLNDKHRCHDCGKYLTNNVNT